MQDWRTLEAEILDYWFGRLDDSTPLVGGTEPFATHIALWCAKDSAIDEKIRDTFEAAYLEVTGSPQVWTAISTEARRSDRGSLALTVLLDQFPRNMYRGTPRMYAHDGLALAFASRAIDAGYGNDLSLVEQMFLYLPLMHAEDLALQHVTVGLFEGLLRDCEARCPHSREYYEGALASARRHRSVVERFGRFPHRNAILGRKGTAEEEAALRNEDVSF